MSNQSNQRQEAGNPRSQECNNIQGKEYYIYFHMQANSQAYDEDAAIIQLVGDMKDNVEQLIKSIGCQCGTRGHLRTIFSIYCDKIAKLRAQRDHYRGLYEELQARASSPQSLSQASTNQASQHRRESSNIFQMLHRELYVPVSIQSKSLNLPSDRSNISYLLNEPSNPEDSLLISESSTQRPNAGKGRDSHKENVAGLAKSFEEFLQERVEQNQMKAKIGEDMLALCSKKNRLATRKPLADRQY